MEHLKEEANKFLGCDHVPFDGHVDGANGGTIHIDRDRQIIHVRPSRSRVYSMRLVDVASIVVSRVIKNELAQQGRPVPAARK